jgi:ribonucleoside-diphosphate reductase alpha chain
VTRPWATTRAPAAASIPSANSFTASPGRSPIWGLADGYFEDDESAENSYADLTWLCLHQYGAFNSPVWFNVGPYHQYGISETSGEGNWYWNAGAGKARRAPGQYHYPQASACF